MNKLTTKVHLFPLILLVLVSFFCSCRYEEGPGVSFRSPETRIVGLWKLQGVELNGALIDSTSRHGNQPGNIFNIDYNGDLVVYAIIDEESRRSDYGEWFFMNNSKDLEVFYVIKNQTYQYLANITKLSYEELRYEYTDENDDHWKLTFYAQSR